MLHCHSSPSWWLEPWPPHDSQSCSWEHKSWGMESLTVWPCGPQLLFFHFQGHLFTNTGYCTCGRQPDPRHRHCTTHTWSCPAVNNTSFLTEHTHIYSALSVYSSDKYTTTERCKRLIWPTHCEYTTILTAIFKVYLDHASMPNGRYENLWQWLSVSYRVDVLRVSNIVKALNWQ